MSVRTNMTTPNKLIEEAVEELENLVQWEAPEHEEEVKHWLRNTLTKHEDAVVKQIDQIIIGWREKDWPEGFDRRTAQMIADNYEKRTDPLRANQSDHEHN